MDLWMQIGSAILIGMMLIAFGPGLWRMARNSPKGSASDWMSVAMVLALVVLFVIVLVALV